MHYKTILLFLTVDNEDIWESIHTTRWREGGQEKVGGGSIDTRFSCETALIYRQKSSLSVAPLSQRRTLLVLLAGCRPLHTFILHVSQNGSREQDTNKEEGIMTYVSGHILSVFEWHVWWKHEISKPGDDHM